LTFKNILTFWFSVKSRYRYQTPEG